MSLCENPFMVGSLPCSCGKCEPCTKSRTNKWKNRINLESYGHESSAFVTLTYTDENLRFQNPKTGEFTLPTLIPSDPRNFIKRIRKAHLKTIHSDTGKSPLRYYLCGEYGDTNWRPHYHMALFGYEPCYRGQTDKLKHSEGNSCCPPCDLLKETWKLGSIDNAPLNDKTAAYVAGYITKKLTMSDDSRLEGRFPEFQRMSNRPGLGANAVEAIADALFSKFGKDMLTEHSDVPTLLTQGKTQIILDRYIKNKLRDAIGVDDETIQKTKKAHEDELLSMYADILFDPEVPQNKKPHSLKQFILDQNKQKVLNLKTLHEIHKKRRNL